MIKNRHRDLIELLKRKPFMTIEELCQQLDVSPATVRRDLSLLESEGEILRLNGGAMYIDKDGVEREMTSFPHFEEKTRIAKAAAALVKEGDTLFIDAGSTTQLIAQQLMNHTNITVITNSLEIAYQLNTKKDRREISVIICGGTLGEGNSHSIAGPVAEKMISMFRANICFLSTAGFDIKQGVTDPHLTLTRVKQNMIEHSNKVYLVTDHSKFGVINTAFVCPLEKITHIITDAAAPADDIRYIRSKGVGVTLV